MEARSEGLGLGCEFVVRLPLAASTMARPAAAQADAARAVPYRILVVDDNRDAAELLRMLLEVLGAEILVAHDGEAGLEALKHFRPSGVLLDLGLPGMDGHELARRMRAEPYVPLDGSMRWLTAADRGI